MPDRTRTIQPEASRLWIIFIENTTGFYFFRPYNARLAAAIAALVHRYLTYLSREFNRACLKNSQIFCGFPG